VLRPVAARSAESSVHAKDDASPALEWPQVDHFVFPSWPCGMRPPLSHEHFTQVAQEYSLALGKRQSALKAMADRWGVTGHRVTLGVAGAP